MQALLDDAQAAYQQSQADLKAGNLGAYQNDISRMEGDLQAGAVTDRVDGRRHPTTTTTTTTLPGTEAVAARPERAPASGVAGRGQPPVRAGAIV